MDRTVRREPRARVRAAHVPRAPRGTPELWSAVAVAADALVVPATVLVADARVQAEPLGAQADVRAEVEVRVPAQRNHDAAARAERVAERVVRGRAHQPPVDAPDLDLRRHEIQGRAELEIRVQALQIER